MFRKLEHHKLSHVLPVDCSSPSGAFYALTLIFLFLVKKKKILRFKKNIANNCLYCFEDYKLLKTIKPYYPGPKTSLHLSVSTLIPTIFCTVDTIDTILN